MAEFTSYDYDTAQFLNALENIEIMCCQRINLKIVIVMKN